MYKTLGNASKAYPTKEAGSYRLVLVNGLHSYNEYEPISNSIYLKGAKHLSCFLAFSTLLFILECVAGKRVSLQPIKRVYWSIKGYGRQYFNTDVFKYRQNMRKYIMVGN